MADHFDDRAATWDDDPSHVERADVVVAVLRDAVALDPSVRVLEYGAGTGLVSERLRDAVGAVTVADTSAGMRAVLDAKVANGSLAGARVWDADLAAGPTSLDAGQFDLIVTVL